MAIDTAAGSVSSTSSEVAKPATREKVPSRSEQRAAKRADEKRSLAAVRREEASEIAADMEMGYYVGEDGIEWPAKTFSRAEVLRKMGYGVWFVKNGRLPAWWPGTAEFRRHVSWKVAVRRMQSHLDLTRHNAWAGPLIGLGVEEMGRRLALTPELVSDRDLTDLITKLTRIFADGAPASGGSAPVPGGESKPGVAARFTRITETIELLPEGPAREKAKRDYDAILTEARAAIAPPAAT